MNNLGWMCFCLFRLDGLNHERHEYAMTSSLRITSRLEVLLQTLLRAGELSSDLRDGALQQTAVWRLTRQSGGLGVCRQDRCYDSTRLQ